MEENTEFMAEETVETVEQPAETAENTEAQETAQTADAPDAEPETQEPQAEQPAPPNEVETLRAELNRARNSPESMLMERLAREAGMSRENYMQALLQELEKNKVNKLTQQGVPEEYARRMLDLERKERQREIREARFRQESERRRQFAELVQEYPNLKELPKEVVNMMNQGASPLNAMRAYELKQLKEENAKLKQKMKNKASSPGSMNDLGESPKMDDFLAGFCGE